MIGRGGIKTLLRVIAAAVFFATLHSAPVLSQPLREDVWIHTTVEDFSGCGIDNGASVTNIAGGEVRLPALVEDYFDQSPLDTTKWTGNASITGGILTVDASNIRSIASVDEDDLPVAVEGRVRFVEPGVGSGWGDYGLGKESQVAGVPNVLFLSDGDSNVYANDYQPGDTAPQRTQITGFDWAEYQDVRFVLYSDQVDYYVNGSLEVSHTLTTPMTMPMYLWFWGEWYGYPFRADWLRVAIYPATDVYTSCPVIVGGTASWGSLAWDGDTPAGTSVSFETRSSEDGESYSEWEPLGAGNAINSPAGSYLQYQITLNTSDPMLSPQVDEVSITFNTAPTAEDDTFAVDENSPNGTSVGTVSASDPDPGESLTYGITAGNTGDAFAIGDSTGVITVSNSSALDYETNPSFGLTVVVTDTGNLTGTASITVTLNDVNDAPTPGDDSGPGFGTDKNTAFTTASVLTNDDDPDGDAIAFDSYDDTGVVGILSYNGNNTFDYDPNGQFASLGLGEQAYDIFTYVISDTAGLTGTATVSITVTGENTPPIANDDSGVGFETDEDSALTTGDVLSNDTDAETPGNLTVDTYDDSGLLGVLSYNGDGTFDYDPNGQLEYLMLGEQAEEVFTYVATDGVLTDSATVSITVTGLNDSPVAEDATFTVDENTANGVSVDTVPAADPDGGDSLSYGITAGNEGDVFAIDGGTGEITVNDSSALDYETTPSFGLTVVVTDSTDLTDSASITITVNDVNEAPTAEDDTFTVDENSANGMSVGTVSASDPDGGDSLSYGITAGNEGDAFAIDGSTGEITVDDSSALDFETTPSFGLTVVVTDTGDLTDSASITVNLNNVNDAPTDVGLDSNSVDENEPANTVVGNLSTTDQDSADDHTYSLVDTGPCPGPDNGSFNVDAAELRTDTPFDYETTATYTVCVRTDDGNGGTYDEQFAITVNDVNDPPTDIGLDNTGVDENEPVNTVVGNLSTTDQDTDDSHTYSLVDTGGCAGPDNDSFNINAAELRTSAVFNYEATDTYTVCVRTDDGNGGTYDKQFVINVNDVNEAPTDISLDSSSVDENEPANTVVGNLSTTDQDTGDSHTYSLEDTGGCAGLGPDNDSFNIAGAQLRSSEVFDYEATDSYVICVRTDDGNGGTYDEQFVIDVDDVNEAPTDIGLDSSSVDENEPTNTVVGNLSTTDQDTGDSHTYSLEDTGGCAGLGPDNDSFNIAGAQLRSSEVFNYEATDSYVICVRTDDGNGGTYDEQFEISVNDVNDDPTNIGLSSTDVDENEPSNTVVGDLSTTDQDSGDVHTYSLVDTGGCPGPDNGSFNIAGAQLRTAGPLDHEAAATRTICVRTDDGNGGMYDKQFEISVNDVNDDPTDIGLSNTDVDENEPTNTVVGDLSTTDQDSGDVHTYSLVDTGGCPGPDNSSFNIAGAQLRTGAVFDYETTDSYVICVRTNDGNGGTYDKQFEISVNEVNDDPTDIGLSNTDVDENEPSNTVVGDLSTTDQDTGDVHTYSLVDTGGCPGPDNNSFNIVGAQLRTGAVFDYETTDSYVICIRTDDGNGGTYDKQFEISVNDVNDAPVADDDTFTVDENSANGTSVGTVSASDPDMTDSLTYGITAGNTGDAFAINGSTGEITVDDNSVLDYETTLSFDLTVVVTDTGSLTDSASITVNLIDVNEAPTVSDDTFSVGEGSANGTSVGTVSASDPDTGDSLTYGIMAGNTGDAFAIDGSRGGITVNNGSALDYDTTPSFDLTVLVTDTGGMTDTATAQVTVNNQAPTADAGGPYSGNEGSAISFDASGSSDPGGGDLTYAWDFDEDGVYDDAIGVTLSYTWTQQVALTVGLIITDAGGLTSTAIAQVVVHDVDPTAEFTADPLSGDEPLTVVFTDTSTSHDGITAWQWDLDGDGSADATIPGPTFEYTVTGRYTVTLTVWEGDGDSDTETKVSYIRVGDVGQNKVYLPLVVRGE
jgi:VCBS repeat-containing protein